MAKYKCKICKHIYDEEKEGTKFDDLPADWKCPKCSAPKSLFTKIEETEDNTNNQEQQTKVHELEYVNDIHELAKTGKSIITSMDTKKATINWEDILILGGQLNTIPLDEHEEIITKTIIGKKAKKPMILESPIYISHMSYGALSKEIKIALAKGSALAKTATCSGEGGILPEEFDNAYKYIFEYVPNLYSVNEANLKKVDAIEIKIGQGTKPGMGGHLPGDKVTEEIAKVRGKKIGKDIISPANFKGIRSKEDLKKLVDELRKKSEGRPIGIKIAAGNIEKDLDYISYAKPDFVTIDGRGGGTGAGPKVIKDATSVPTIFALYRTRKYLDDHNLDIDLVITGGLRLSSDFAKALAMGADAIAIATSAMIAAGCEQYRICESGRCPMGIATQNPELRKRVNIEQSANRVFNYLNVSLEELKTFARITGHSNIHDLNIIDIATINSEISNNTNISHV